MFNHNACNRMKYAHRVAQVLFSSGAKLFQCFLERGENDLERKKKKKGNTFVAGKPYDTLFFEFRLLKLKRNWKAGYKINFYFGNEKFNFDINIKNIKEDVIIKKRRNRFIISKFPFHSIIIANHKEQYNSHIKRNNIRSIVWKSRREKRDLSPFRGLSCARDGIKSHSYSLVFSKWKVSEVSIR